MVSSDEVLARSNDFMSRRSWFALQIRSSTCMPTNMSVVMFYTQVWYSSTYIRRFVPPRRHFKKTTWYKKLWHHSKAIFSQSDLKNGAQDQAHTHAPDGHKRRNTKCESLPFKPFEPCDFMSLWHVFVTCGCRVPINYLAPDKYRSVTLPTTYRLMFDSLIPYRTTLLEEGSGLHTGI